MSTPTANLDAYLETLSPLEIATLGSDWKLWARPSQRVPPEIESGEKTIWLLRTGRRWGKGRSATETLRRWVREGRVRSIIGVGRTAADIRDVMIEGPSGFLAVCDADLGNRPSYNPSKREVRWPNGAVAKLYSADKPDQLRGPGCDAWWADELAAWRYPQAWDNLQMTASEGHSAVPGIVTTTPRPTPLIRSLCEDSDVIVVNGHTFENAANLSPTFLRRMRERYEGTRLGRQELAGEILDDNPGALWRRDDIEQGRVDRAPELGRVVVGVDPAITATETSDSTGIVVAGIDRRDPAHFFVLDDCTVAAASPDQWARAAVIAYHRHEADRIVPEVNQGGDMVVATIRTIDPDVPVRAVHATRGKAIRAEPIAALYEQGRVHHVGSFPELEDQLCEWEPGPGMDSPDRLDALVWALTELSRRGPESLTGQSNFAGIGRFPR